jgi:hypothetical protein
MLNIYMVYSRGGGPEEGAFLVFAHSFQEARKIGWRWSGDEITDDYLDFAARRIRKAEWLRDEADPVKYANDESHVIQNPNSCIHCDLWGHTPIGPDGICEECQDDLDEIEEINKS